METVVKFYVDIEFAGQGMFFTKFQFRHSCSQIFRRFWKSAKYQQQVVVVSRSGEFFDRFLNCLINDMTYCLEEGLGKIEKIKTFELRQDTDPTHIS
jgi:CRISPR/Cas system endoribonuclease Cas6 (RAMP superfamily)